MKRVLCLVLPLVAGGCEKSSPVTAPAPVVETPAVPRPARVEAPTPPPAPVAATASEIDEDVIKKFIGYEKGVLATFGKRLSDVVAEAEKVEAGKDPAAALAQAGRIAGVLKELEADEDKQRQQSSLSKKQVEDLQRLSMQLKAARLATSPELSDQIHMARTGLNALPPELRAAQEAEVKKAEVALVGIQRFDEQRKEFGSKAVEAALKHEPELTALFDERLAIVEKALRK